MSKQVDDSMIKSQTPAHAEPAAFGSPLNQTRPGHMRRYRWWVLLVTLGLSVSFFSMKVRSTRRTCYLKDVEPYTFPLARPPAPRGPKLRPDWVRRPDRPFMRGVSLGLYFKDQRFDYDLFLHDIKHMGASHVGFVISWYQQNVSATKITRHPQKTVSDARLIATIHQARARGLQVFLLPIVRLQHRGADDWRGVIKPTDLDAWWQSYRAYIMHYAALSQRHGVEIFSVGSELVSMEKRKDRWLDLIRNVRRLFRGPLVYSANWDHYEPVDFWEHLDYMGISNYYELSKKILPTVKTLREAWGKIRDKIERWKARYPRQQLMFTEVGYYSQKGTNIYPWDYTRDKELSLEEQRRCYRAFIDIWSKSRSLKGTFFWNWFALGGPKDKGYTPRGKPAECELRHWYQQVKRQAAANPKRRWAPTSPDAPAQAPGWFSAPQGKGHAQDIPKIQQTHRPPPPRRAPDRSKP